MTEKERQRQDSSKIKVTEKTTKVVSQPRIHTNGREWSPSATCLLGSDLVVQQSRRDVAPLAVSVTPYAVRGVPIHRDAPQPEGMRTYKLLPRADTLFYAEATLRAASFVGTLPHTVLRLYGVTISCVPLGRPFLPRRRSLVDSSPFSILNLGSPTPTDRFGTPKYRSRTPMDTFGTLKFRS